MAGYHPQGTAQTKDPGIVSRAEEASSLVPELQPERQASGLADIQWPKQPLLWNGGCRHHLGTLCLPCSSVLVSPGEELTHSSGVLVSMAARQGNPGKPNAALRGGDGQLPTSQGAGGRG